MTATCWACGATRDLHDLLVIRDRLEPERPEWYACRPSVPGPFHDCVRVASGSAERYAVALAVADVPRPDEHPAPDRPAPVHDVVFARGRVAPTGRTGGGEPNPAPREHATAPRGSLSPDTDGPVGYHLGPGARLETALRNFTRRDEFRTPAYVEKPHDDLPD